jgi:SAM-dependent methyltransferase
VSAAARRSLVAITVDYETWQPIPEGRVIDWERDVLDPTARLLDACGALDAPVTLMVEMGEYFWLTENDPELAQRMEAQWRAAVASGHDVQLHLHPNWLPELGARRIDGRWSWDWSLGRMSDYPGDVAALLMRCRDRLETVVRAVDPSFRVSCFRAGAYEAQPFERLHAGLLAAGIECDTSVYAGGRREGRTYDYSLAHSDHQPYFASRTDPQLVAPPAEERVVELPVFAFRRGQTWTFDADEGRTFARHLLDYAKRRPSLHAPRGGDRALALRLRALQAHARLGWARRPLNLVVPRRLAGALVPRPRSSSDLDDSFVLIGHSKGNLEVMSIAANVRELQSAGYRFVSLADLASSARAQLVRARTASLDRGVAAGLARIERDPAVTRALLDRMPLDCESVLDLGGRAGDVLSRRFPWMELHERPKSGSVDAVVALHVLEHASHVHAELADAARALKPGGVFLAAIRSGARKAPRMARMRAWETAPHDVRMRLEQAGFASVEIAELDAYRSLGATADPSSGDRVMLVRARLCAPDYDRRADELVAWIYRSVAPAAVNGSSVPEAIIARRAALCSHYTVALGAALRREGIAVEWISMLALDHPRGRGPALVESHEVIEATYPDQRREVIDAMAGVRFGSDLTELLARPETADVDRRRDKRYRARGYDLYATSRWYGSVIAVARRSDPHRLLRYRPLDRSGRAAPRSARTLSAVGPPSAVARAESLADRVGRRITRRLAAELPAWVGYASDPERLR